MDDQSIYRGLGENIAARRKQLGMKQADLAMQVGLSRASIANIEVGRQKILLHHVYRLARGLKFDSIEKLLPPFLETREHDDSVLNLPVGELSSRQLAQVTHLVNATTVTKLKRGD
jgi:transcriptional regulator with XRE-family HTH domain